MDIWLPPHQKNGRKVEEKWDEIPIFSSLIFPIFLEAEDCPLSSLCKIWHHCGSCSYSSHPDLLMIPHFTPFPPTFPHPPPPPNFPHFPNFYMAQGFGYYLLGLQCIKLDV